VTQIAANRRLCALVVTYNRLDKLKVTIARLLDHPTECLETLIIVNNASTDGTAVWFQ